MVCVKVRADKETVGIDMEGGGGSGVPPPRHTHTHTLKELGVNRLIFIVARCAELIKRRSCVIHFPRSHISTLLFIAAVVSLAVMWELPTIFRRR